MLPLAHFDGQLLQDWFGDAGPWAQTAFILTGIAMISVLVPKTIVSITAGALFGTALGSALMLIIAVLAAALNYSIGHWWLRESIDERIALGGSHNRIIWARAIRDTAREAGFGFHFLMRLSPLPTTVISYAMGASGSRLCPFLLAAAVAVIPQMLWVHSGTAVSLLNEPDPSALRWASIGVSVTAAIIISSIVPRVAARRVQSMRPLPSRAID